MISKSGRRRRLLLPLFIGAVFVLTLMLIAGEDLYSMIDALRHADFLMVGFAICIYFFSVVVWALRWNVSLSFVGSRVGIKDLYMILTGSVFINNITPVMRGGADPLGRVYLVGKLRRVPYSSAFATTLVEHLFDFPVVVSFLMFGLLLVFSGGPSHVFWMIIGSWILLLVLPLTIVIYLVKNKVGIRKLSKFVTVLLRMVRMGKSKLKIFRAISDTYSCSYKVMSRWKCVFSLAALTIFIWILDMVRILLVFLALGYRPGLAMLLLSSSLPTLVGLIPFLPGGLVLVEATMISIFTFFGVPFGLALAATLIERMISFVLSTVVGAGVLSYLGVRAWRAT